MRLGNSVYIDNEDIKEIAKEYSFFIFGAGKDGRKLVSAMKKDIKIIAVVDNCNSRKFIEDIPVISMKNMKEQKEVHHKIIVATSKFQAEIIQQLEDNLLLPEKDYYIWDDKCSYHCNQDIQLFIQHNQRIWKKDSIQKKNRIIMPFIAFDHDLLPVACSYCGNYLAEKYEADMYCNLSTCTSPIPEPYKKIYHSFGVKGFLKPELSIEREKEAEDLAEKIWKSIDTIADWDKIYMFGISFGTSLIRHYLRYFMPSMNILDESTKPWFVESVKRVFFYNDYLDNNNVKAVVLLDGVREESYLRDLAIVKGIPVYAINNYRSRKPILNYVSGKEQRYYKEFWNQLSFDEQVHGIEWAKHGLENRIRGDIADIRYMQDKSPYMLNEIEPVIEANDKIKILICPHAFDEDPMLCGEQLFGTHQFAWLLHLGELSNKMPEYDWYLKPHPNGEERDLKIFEMLVQKYPRISIIYKNVSPIQLKKEGINVALTVCGTLGHEYPLIGIPVINAGANPHRAFDFNYTPKSKEEYDDLIINLKDVIKQEIDKEEIYKFYCIHYRYYASDDKWTPAIYIKNPDLHSFKYSDVKSAGTLGTHRYRIFLEEWTPERHEEIKKNVEKLFERLDNWKEDTFYRTGI